MKSRNYPVLIYLLASWTIVVAGCQSRSFFRPESVELRQEPVVVPISLKGYCPLVEVNINGQGPYTFLVDTGSSVVEMSPELADRLKLPEVPGLHFDLDPLTGKTVRSAKVVRIQALKIGEAEFAEFGAVVLDSAILKERGFDGILGLPLFADCLLTIDLSAGQIVIEKGELPKPNGKDILAMSYRYGIPTVPVLICGMQKHLFVDTGSDIGIALSDRLAGKTLPVEIDQEAEFKARPITGTEIWPKAQLKGNIKLGQFLLKNPVVAIIPIKDDGLIGTSVLWSIVMTFDQQQGTIRLHPGIYHPFLSGLAMRPTGDGWLISDVEEGTPAARSGIKPGDIILEINGQSVSNLRPKGLKGLRRKTGSFNLLLKRNGKSIELEVLKQK